MVTVSFTPNLHRHLDSELTSHQVAAASVGGALDQVFDKHPRLRSYVLDDQGGVRKHVAVFLDGKSVSDRQTLSDPVAGGAEIYVMQALSGG